MKFKNIHPLPSLSFKMNNKKMRCIKGIEPDLTTGKIYEIVGDDLAYLHIINNSGEEQFGWSKHRFEEI